MLLLVFAAVVSVASGEWIDASIVAAIVGASVGIGYWREYGAETAIAELLERIQATAQVVRDGREMTIPLRDVVRGDIVLLAAGSIVPADAVLTEATELHVDDAVLTGESFPALKRPGICPPNATIRERTNCVHFGTNVRSGTARRRFWESPVGSTLMWTTAVVAIIAFALPYAPIGRWLGFAAPPPLLMLAVVALTAAYVGASELLKSWFYRDTQPQPLRELRATPSVPRFA